MGVVERKVFLIKPERNKDPVAYVNIPADVKKFYCYESDGVWYADRVRIVFDEETGIMVVVPKWIERKAEAIGSVVKGAVEGAVEGSEDRVQEEDVAGNDREGSSREQESGEQESGKKESGSGGSGVTGSGDEKRKRRPIVF